MTMSNANGQPYIAALDPAVDRDGEWFPTDDTDTISVSVDLDANGGTLSGYLFGEFTADKMHLFGVSRICWPYGALHLKYTGVSMSAAADQVDVVAAGSGAFSLSFSAPGVGQMRFRWHAGGVVGGAGSPKIRVYTGGNDR